MRDPGSGVRPDTIVFREHKAGIRLGCGGLALFWALLIVGFASLSANENLNMQVYAFAGVLLVITVLGWLGAANGFRLEVSTDAIATRSRWRPGPATLTRDKRDTLRIVPDGMLPGKRPSGTSLIVLGTGGFARLRRLDPDEVKRACEARGWRFDGDTGLAVTDVRSYLSRGEVEQAMRVTELFGPFPGAVADGSSYLALSAAVFEAYGDSLDGTSGDLGWGGARDSYRQAVDAQKIFAVAADARAEREARDAEALRLEEKRQNSRGPRAR